jgi:hypothetical protein
MAVDHSGRTRQRTRSSWGAGCGRCTRVGRGRWDSRGLPTVFRRRWSDGGVPTERFRRQRRAGGEGTAAVGLWRSAHGNQPGAAGPRGSDGGRAPNPCRSNRTAHREWPRACGDLRLACGGQTVAVGPKKSAPGNRPGAVWPRYFDVGRLRTECPSHRTVHPDCPQGARTARDPTGVIEPARTDRDERTGTTGQSRADHCNQPDAVPAGCPGPGLAVDHAGPPIAVGRGPAALRDCIPLARSSRPGVVFPRAAGFSAVRLKRGWSARRNERDRALAPSRPLLLGHSSWKTHR